MKFSHSRLGVLETCSKKYWHKYVNETQTDDLYKSPAMEFGSVWHSGLDKLYTKFYKEDLSVFSATLSAWHMLKAEYKQVEDTFLGKKDKTLSKLRCMLGAYVRRHLESDGYLNKDKYDLISSEEEFVVHKETYSYHGFIDKVLRRRGTEDYMILEHKTTSSYTINKGFSRKYLSGLMQSTQAVMYRYHVKKTWSVGSKRPEVQVLLDVSNTNTKTSETLLVDLSLMLSDKDPYERNLLRWVKTVEFYHEQAIWPKAFSACVGTYGMCKYFYECQLGE